jgi:hypothetical protein
MDVPSASGQRSYVIPVNYVNFLQTYVTVFDADGIFFAKQFIHLKM